MVRYSGVLTACVLLYVYAKGVCNVESTAEITKRRLFLMTVVASQCDSSSHFSHKQNIRREIWRREVT